MNVKSYEILNKYGQFDDPVGFARAVDAQLSLVKLLHSTQRRKTCKYVPITNKPPTNGEAFVY